jgi:hypothetical protein
MTRKRLRVLDLFSGIGGMSLGLERTGGFETVAFCEVDTYANRVLNKWWPHVPIFSHGIVGLNALLKRVRTSSRRVFPARTFHSLAQVPDLPAPVRDSSGRFYEPFAWYDHEARCWRTWQRCLVEGWTLFSGTWPRSGMTRSGIAYRRAPLVPLTDATVSGYCLPTPTRMDAHGSRNRTAARSNPNSKHHDGVTLNDFVRMNPWPTPRATDGSHGGRVTNLIEAVSARTFATPTSRDWRSGKASPETLAKNSRPLSEQIGGALNPQFVEWLMGFPKDFTSIGPKENGRVSRASKKGSRAVLTDSDASATPSSLRSPTGSDARSLSTAPIQISQSPEEGGKWV